MYDRGIHTFVDYGTAKRAYTRLRRNHFKHLVIVKVQVKDHLASGEWKTGLTYFPSETWRYAKIIKVYK
jgi:SAM-dependent MidA family methyltransferase